MNTGDWLSFIEHQFVNGACPQCSMFNEIISWCAANNVPIIKDLDHDLTVSDFRDNIHLSAHGQRNMANHLKRYLKQ